MEVWERKAARAVNAARSLVRNEQSRLFGQQREAGMAEGRHGELEEILDILNQASAHIDPHGVVGWEYDTPLPF